SRPVQAQRRRPERRGGAARRQGDAEPARRSTRRPAGAGDRGDAAQPDQAAGGIVPRTGGAGAEQRLAAAGEVLGKAPRFLHRSIRVERGADLTEAAAPDLHTCRCALAPATCRGGKPMNEPNETTAEAVSPEATQDAAAVVIEDLEKLRARAEERDQFLALLQRTQADFENYQKRNQREREQEWRYRGEGMARDLLAVLDNLERALDAAQQANESGPLVKGVGMVLNQFLD